MLDLLFLKRLNQDVVSIIHSGIWRPSRFDFWYFVTFIDEYSRHTWVYLLKGHF